MTSSRDATAMAWPGFQPDGGLLLPLPTSVVSLPCLGSLDMDGQRFIAKLELHVTLLNRVLGTSLREVLGVDTVRRYFEAQEWTTTRTGDGQLLHQIKHDGVQPLVCGSIIERVHLPALSRFRAALGLAAKMDLPEVLPHVTLYAAGDPVGIGLPDLAALNAAKLADIRLPGIKNRLPPPLSQALLAAYQATHFVIDVKPPIALKIGAASSSMDLLLQDHNSKRAIIVTAFNPFSEATDPRANSLRQQMLRCALDHAGLQVLDAEGRDPECQWPTEPSLLVFGAEPAFEDSLLRDYEQHALVVVTPGDPVALVMHPDHRR